MNNREKTGPVAENRKPGTGAKKSTRFQKGLTGTPGSNGLMDLFAEFKLLDLGKRLGKFIGQYRSAFFRPDRTNGNIVYSYSLLPGAEKEIYRRIGDITISMKACGNLKLPELISNCYEVEMDPYEREVYDDMNGASGLDRSWTESAGGRKHNLLVLPDLVPGTVSADECQALPAGPEGADRCYPAHHLQGHN